MYKGAFTWFDTEVIPEAYKKKMYVDGIEQMILEDEGGTVKKHFEPSDELLLPRSKQLQMNGARVSETQNRVITWHYLDGTLPESTKRMMWSARRVVVDILWMGMLFVNWKLATRLLFGDERGLRDGLIMCMMRVQGYFGLFDLAYSLHYYLVFRLGWTLALKYIHLCLHHLVARVVLNG